MFAGPRAVPYAGDVPERAQWDVAVVGAGPARLTAVRQRAPVRALGQAPGHASARLADGSAVTARVIIGADGSSGVSARHVGVIAARGNGDATRDYLREFTARLGLASCKVLRDSGHLTRCRAAGSSLRKGRVLVAGDAAGLPDPWTREGISSALRPSARMALSALNRV